MVYTKRGLERAKTVPAVHIESLDTKNGSDDPSAGVPDKASSMDTKISELHAPYQSHSKYIFLYHQLGVIFSCYLFGG